MLYFPGFGKIETNNECNYGYKKDILKPSYKEVISFPKEKHFQRRLKSQTLYNTTFSSKIPKANSNYTSPCKLLEYLKSSTSEDGIVV